MNVFCFKNLFQICDFKLSPKQGNQNTAKKGKRRNEQECSHIFSADNGGRGCACYLLGRLYLIQWMARASSPGYSLAFFLNTGDLLILTSLLLYYSPSSIIPRSLFAYPPSLFPSAQAELCWPWLCRSLSYGWKHCVSCGSVPVPTGVHWVLLWSKFARA